jgi:hypothetical protein
MSPTRPSLKFAILICAILAINTSKFSVGGTADGGVPIAIGRVVAALNEGQTHFFKSDIAAFFTAIPHKPVVEIIRRETGDNEFADFFARAVVTELANKDQLAEFFDIFPHDGIGVPQGSSRPLSVVEQTLATSQSR